MKLNDVLDSVGSDRFDRDALTGLLKAFGWTFVFDQRGDYDSGADGFLVYTDPVGVTWKFEFTDDSYSSGNVDAYYAVKAQQKTITVYE